MPKHLEFERIPSEEIPTRYFFIVKSVKEKECVGKVQYSVKSRKYVFSSRANMLWGASSLRELADFLHKMNNEPV